MNINYSDKQVSGKKIDKLETYRSEVMAVVNAANFTKNESSLATWQDELMKTGVDEICQKIGKITDLLLIGIGGSSLGTEAVYEALKTTDSPRLHVLDTISDSKIEQVFAELEGVQADDLAVCVISKSGGTMETQANTSVMFEKLSAMYGEVPFQRVVCIGNEGNDLMAKLSGFGTLTLPMHEAIGGRYSVFTAVGLLPLKLLGFDTEALLEGLKSATCCGMDDVMSESAVDLYEHLLSGTRTVNYFAFDTRLEVMGQWYRQLVAESIGKQLDRDGNKVDIGFVPTISTPVELHSIGQLYFSGFAGVYTNFVSVKNTENVNSIAETCQVIPKHAGKEVSRIARAIEQGVLAAYEERGLPFRQVTLDKLDEHEVGIYMGSMMLETMYLAELMNVNAFDQPNVELYKVKTKEVLDS